MLLASAVAIGTYLGVRAAREAERQETAPAVEAAKRAAERMKARNERKAEWLKRAKEAEDAGLPPPPWPSAIDD